MQTQHTIEPVTDPVGQVEYWIGEGIKAHTSMTEAEAQRSTRFLLHQWEAERGEYAAMMTKIATILAD